MNNDEFVLHLNHTATNTTEYDRTGVLYTGTLILDQKRCAAKIDRWRRLKDYLVDMTCVVTVSPPGGVSSSKPAYTRRISGVHEKGSTLVIQTTPLEIVNTDTANISTPPGDYSFLGWLWGMQSNEDEVLESYHAVTGLLSPYLSKEEAEKTTKLKELCKTYADELRERKMPSVVLECTVEGCCLLPTDRLVRSSMRDALKDFYNVGNYVDDVFGTNTTIRKKTRTKDVFWWEKLLNSVAWYNRLAIKDYERVGTTNPDQLKQLQEDYSVLTAIKPAHKYEIVDEDDFFAYNSVTRLDPSKWNKEEVDRLVYQGYVIGPFAYNTEKEALNAQNRRLV